jgi:hypothetical protein
VQQSGRVDGVEGGGEGQAGARNSQSDEARQNRAEKTDMSANELDAQVTTQLLPRQAIDEWRQPSSAGLPAGVAAVS